MRKIILVMALVFVVSSVIFSQSFVGSKNGLIKTNWHWPDLKLSFMKLNKDGQKVFNGWSLLCPVQIEIPRTEKKSAQLKISIPFQYARLFERDSSAGKALHDADYARASQFVSNELQKQLKNALEGFEMNKEVYNLSHPNYSQIHHLKITNFHGEGFASPEGPKIKGFKTLTNGAVDIQNLALADKRALACMGYVASVLASDGYPQMADTLNANPREWEVWTSVEELQLTMSEWKTLDSLASRQGYAGHSITERVWHAIIAYNDGSMVGNARIIFDNIIGSKRSVCITYDLSGEKNNVILIPIPWLLLLLLIPIRRKGFKEAPKPTEYNNIPNDFVPGTEPPFEGYYIPGNEGVRIVPPPFPPIEDRYVIIPKEENIKSEKFFLDDIPHIFWEVQLPNSSSLEYMEMEEATVVDDLWVFWKDENIFSKGLNYADICADIQYIYHMESEESREIYFTHKIIKLWEVIDEKKYENDEYQIRWARMHARLLIKIVDIKREGISKGNLSDYWTIVNNLAHTLHKRRVERRKRS